MKKFMLAMAVVCFLNGCASSSSLQNESQASDAGQAEVKSSRDDLLQQRINSINLATGDAGAEPAKYKKRVKKAIEAVLETPDSAKFSGFTAPRKEVLLDRGKLIYGYSTCVYVDQISDAGTYTGATLYWVFMRGNTILRIKNTQTPAGRTIFPGRSIRCD